jgi:hypothetical protein
MTELYSFLLAVLVGLVRVLAHPLFYVALLLVFLQYWRQNGMERRMFGVRVTSLADQFVRSLTCGLAGGLVATILLTLVGAVLAPHEILYVWVVALALSVINVRYICFAYAGGLLSVVSLILQALPEFMTGPAWWLTILHDLRGLHIPQLMALVAILHLVEALLVRWNGAEQPLPVFVSGKRGRLIGGFILQKFWVVPMAAFVVTGTDHGVHAPSWWPLLGGMGAVGAGLQAVPFPAVLGYSGVALTQSPQKKALGNAKFLGFYAVILLALAIGGSYWTPLLWLTALFCTIAHETLILWEIRLEQSGQPHFVRPLQGLKILTVLPKSPAQEMGLLSGETILRVNGTPVSTPYDLHFAINQNPAYAKLELLSPEGEPRFSSTPIYMGDHHQLGIILVPDDQARQYVRLDSINPWRWLWGRLVGGGKQAPSTYH